MTRWDSVATDLARQGAHARRQRAIGRDERMNDPILRDLRRQTEASHRAEQEATPAPTEEHRP